MKVFLLIGTIYDENDRAIKTIYRVFDAPQLAHAFGEVEFDNYTVMELEVNETF